jgi:hypothetical protein
MHLFATYCESFLGIYAGTREMKFGSFENLPQCGGQRRLKLRESPVIIRRVQPIVGDDDEFVQVEPHASVSFQKPGRLKRGSEDRREVLDGGQRRWSFPVVHQTGASITHIDADVSFVRNKKDAGTVVDMTVVMDIDQQMSGKILSLNPTVKDGDKSTQAHRCGISGEKLDPKFMNFHYSFPAALPL